MKPVALRKALDVMSRRFGRQIERAALETAGLHQRADPFAAYRARCRENRKLRFHLAAVLDTFFRIGGAGELVFNVAPPEAYFAARAFLDRLDEPGDGREAGDVPRQANAVRQNPEDLEDDGWHTVHPPLDGEGAGS